MERFCGCWCEVTDVIDVVVVATVTVRVTMVVLRAAASAVLHAVAGGVGRGDACKGAVLRARRRAAYGTRVWG